MPCLELIRERPFRPLNIAVLTVSDSRTPADDRSGDLLVERLTAAGHRLAARALVVDDAEPDRGPARAPGSTIPRSTW